MPRDTAGANQRPRPRLSIEASTVARQRPMSAAYFSSAASSTFGRPARICLSNVASRPRGGDRTRPLPLIRNSWALGFSRLLNLGALGLPVLRRTEELVAEPMDSTHRAARSPFCCCWPSRARQHGCAIDASRPPPIFERPVRQNRIRAWLARSRLRPLPAPRPCAQAGRKRSRRRLAE